MVISHVLRLNGGGGGVEWICHMHESVALIRGILALIQPNLFDNGVQALKKHSQKKTVLYESTSSYQSTPVAAPRTGRLPDRLALVPGLTAHAA